MTKPDYFKFAEQFFGACLEISKAKNADYTGGAQDPFANFKAVEILGITTEQGFLTRMMDKMKRIASFAEKGELQVKDESVTDTLRDLANYACLLAGYIESKKTAGPGDLEMQPCAQYEPYHLGGYPLYHAAFNNDLLITFNGARILVPKGSQVKLSPDDTWKIIPIIDGIVGKE